jgi:uncharacterized Zn finger protein
MPREDSSAKARRMLQEARVNLRRVDAEQIRAVVRGDSARTYSVVYEARDGRWTCDCDAASMKCSHVQAVMLVTIVGGVA